MVRICLLVSVRRRISVCATASIAGQRAVVAPIVWF
jgi:hypothetical protein